MGVYIVSGIFLFAALLRLYKIRKIYDFRKRGVETIAKVLKKEAVEVKWGMEKYWLHYAYNISGEVFKNKSEVGIKLFAETSPEDELTIIYQKNKPKLSYLRSWYRENLSTQLTLAFSFILAAMLVPILF